MKPGEREREMFMEVKGIFLYDETRDLDVDVMNRQLRLSHTNFRFFFFLLKMRSKLKEPATASAFHN